MTKPIKFIEGTEADIPKTGERLNSKDVKALDAVFRKHIHAPIANPARPPCHVIACVVGKKEIWCYYHCKGN
jgi:hypothetical protein